MPIAVTLCLDPVSSGDVTALCRLLAEKRITDYAERLGYRPHVTLLRYDDLPTDAALRVLTRFAAEVSRLAVKLEDVALFSGPAPVLWIAPASNPALLALQGRLHDALMPHVPAPNYQPKTWQPHLTLAEGLTPESAADALLVVKSAFAPMDGWFDRLELVRFPPVGVIWSRSLQNSPVPKIRSP